MGGVYPTLVGFSDRDAWRIQRFPKRAISLLATDGLRVVARIAPKR